MSEREELEATEAAERDMERDADDMQEGVDRLEGHIEEAEDAARARPEVPDEAEQGDEEQGEAQWPPSQS